MPPEENVSRKQDWNFGPFNMQSSATTRSQATSMQLSYNRVSCQGCLYSGLGTRLYTQSAWTGFNPYYPVGHYQSSVGPYQWRGLGITTRIAYTQNTRMVCSYVTLKRSGVTHASFPAALAHWSIYKRGQAGVQGYTLHSYIPIKSVDRHLQAVGSS